MILIFRFPARKKNFSPSPVFFVDNVGGSGYDNDNGYH